jgi:hypothetical protein
MSEWSTTAVSNVYTSPSQTGWSACHQGEGEPVFPPSQPMQALAIVRGTAGVENKKPLLLHPGRNPDRRDWAGCMSKGSIDVGSYANRSNAIAVSAYCQVFFGRPPRWPLLRFVCALLIRRTTSVCR